MKELKISSINRGFLARDVAQDRQLTIFSLTIVRVILNSTKERIELAHKLMKEAKKS